MFHSEWKHINYCFSLKTNREPELFLFHLNHLRKKRRKTRNNTETCSKRKVQFKNDKMDIKQLLKITSKMQ